MKLRLDSFAYRQFEDPNYAGTKISVSKEEFMKQVKANSVGILTELKEKLRIDAHKLIDAHMDNLIMVK